MRSYLIPKREKFMIDMDWKDCRRVYMNMEDLELMIFCPISLEGGYLEVWEVWVVDEGSHAKGVKTPFIL